MAEEADPASVIEKVLRGTVPPGSVIRVRPMSDDELALDIVEGLDAAGFEVVLQDRDRS